jgi:hypothetical protein
MSDILGALLGAGLVLEWLHEFPYCAWPVVAGTQLVERFSSSHGYYGLPDTPEAPFPINLPLMFSVRARRPA